MWMKQADERWITHDILTTLSPRLWKYRLLLLVQIFIILIWKLLLITGKKAYLILTSVFCSWRLSLSKSAVMLPVYIVNSMEIDSCNIQPFLSNKLSLRILALPRNTSSRPEFQWGNSHFYEVIVKKMLKFVIKHFKLFFIQEPRVGTLHVKKVEGLKSFLKK